MKVGKKSLLFGVHQFIWHPLTVLLAWWKLYGRPSWKEAFCILIHDWGYWFSSDMDGPEGRRHPEFAARLAGTLFGSKYNLLCLYHSRHYARNTGAEPSKLCWADKLSIIFEPWWLYLPRAWLSGELKEYRQVAAKAGFIPLSASNRQWFDAIKIKLSSQALKKRADLISYTHPLHGMTR